MVLLFIYVYNHVVIGSEKGHHSTQGMPISDLSSAGGIKVYEC